MAFWSRKPVAAEPELQPFDWRKPHTPDWWRLEQFETQLVFIPDEVKTNGKYHDFIEDEGLMINPSCYTHEMMTFWLKDLGESSYPIPLPGDFRPEGFVRWPIEAAPIQGELWLLNPNQIYSLDIHKGNTVRFNRERVLIKYPYRGVRNVGPNPKITPHCFKLVTAWMYKGLTHYWADQVGGIFTSQMDLHEHDVPRDWIRKFYKFQPPQK